VGLASLKASSSDAGNVGSDEQLHYVPAKQLIVPGVGIGDFNFGTSKDDVLKKQGQ
jgi:hypothetical protein